MMERTRVLHVKRGVDDGWQLAYSRIVVTQRVRHLDDAAIGCEIDIHYGGMRTMPLSGVCYPGADGV